MHNTYINDFIKPVEFEIVQGDEDSGLSSGISISIKQVTGI